MNRNNPPPYDSPADDLDEKLLLVLRLDGTLAPETEDEVAAVEAEENEDEVELPASLMNERQLVEQIAAGFAPNVVQFQAQESPEIEQELARAARLGKAISPEIEERMRADKRRSQAEADETKQRTPE